MRGARFRLAVLASGSGTNLQAILDTLHRREGIEVAGVGSDKPEAGALGRGRAAGIETAVFPRDCYESRAARDAAIGDWVEGLAADLVVLAGYMQLLTTQFLERFPGRILNVHPSLLPAFPGAHAVEDALAHGVKVTGATVHFVDEGIDTGPIVLQEAVEVREGDTPETLHARIQAVEHRLLPAAVRLFLDGKLSSPVGAA